MKKKGNKIPRLRQEIIDNPIPTSLFFNGVATHLQVFIPSTHKQQNSCIAYKQRCRDRVINDFLSRSRHLLVPLLFHEVTSLHPPSFQRNDFSTCLKRNCAFGFSCKSALKSTWLLVGTENQFYSTFLAMIGIIQTMGGLLLTSLSHVNIGNPTSVKITSSK